MQLIKQGLRIDGAREDLADRDKVAAAGCDHLHKVLMRIGVNADAHGLLFLNSLYLYHNFMCVTCQVEKVWEFKKGVGSNCLAVLAKNAKNALCLSRKLS